MVSISVPTSASAYCGDSGFASARRLSLCPLAGATGPHIRGMQLDLTDEERNALTQHLRVHIRVTPYPSAASLPLIKGILGKIDPTWKFDPPPEPARR